MMQPKGRFIPIVLYVIILASRVVGCSQPKKTPADNSPSTVPSPSSDASGLNFKISSPVANAVVSGTAVFSVSVADSALIESVKFEVIDSQGTANELAIDTTSIDGYKTFVNSKNFPEGLLGLRANVSFDSPYRGVYEGPFELTVSKQ
jgi:hypothetical protein